MYIESIIEEARDLLGDTKAPYLWAEKEMLRYYKNIVNEFCRETFIYTDEDTTAVCKITLVAGTHTYPLSEYILAINSAYLVTNKSPVYPIELQILELTAYDWRSTTGTPYRFIQNIQQQKIRIYPYYPATPAISEILAMNVYRLPDMSLLTVDTWDTTSPPIQDRWHSKLVTGIMAEAYNKRDSETYDPRERDRLRIEWEGIKQEAKRDVILLSDSGERFNPNEGAI